MVRSQTLVQERPSLRSRSRSETLTCPRFLRLLRHRRQCLSYRKPLRFRVDHLRSKSLTRASAPIYLRFHETLARISGTLNFQLPVPSSPRAVSSLSPSRGASTSLSTPKSLPKIPAYLSTRSAREDSIGCETQAEKAGQLSRGRGGVARAPCKHVRMKAHEAAGRPHRDRCVSLVAHPPLVCPGC